jgi:hypothetical protein
MTSALYFLEKKSRESFPCHDQRNLTSPISVMPLTSNETMPKYTPSDVTLRVTTGSAYDRATHLEVPVNTATPVRVESDLIEADVCVRVQDFRGLPRGSPETSAYFKGDRAAQGGWLYSISFGFTLKGGQKGKTIKKTRSEGEGSKEGGEAESEHDGKNGENVNGGSTQDDSSDSDSEDPEAAGVSGADLQWGNDFDRPVREHLPPGFNAALRIAKWMIDPGLDGDIYADRPYLFGPVLSSMNTVYMGRPPVSEEFGLDVSEGEAEDADGDADSDDAENETSSSLRQRLGMPADSAERIRWALRRDWSGNMPALDEFVWRYDTPYGVDFANGYIDFANFNLRLPGYALGVLSVWDGQPFRYVLRNRRTGEVYLVVVFDLLVKEELTEDGSAVNGRRVRKGVRVETHLDEEGEEVAGEVDPGEVDENVEEGVVDGEVEAARAKTAKLDIGGQRTYDDDVD